MECYRSDCSLKSWRAWYHHGRKLEEEGRKQPVQQYLALSGRPTHGRCAGVFRAISVFRGHARWMVMTSTAPEAGLRDARRTRLQKLGSLRSACILSGSGDFAAGSGLNDADGYRPGGYRSRHRYCQPAQQLDALWAGGGECWARKRIKHSHRQFLLVNGRITTAAFDEGGCAAGHHRCAGSAVRIVPCRGGDRLPYALKHPHRPPASRRSPVAINPGPNSTRSAGSSASRARSQQRGPFEGRPWSGAPVVARQVSERAGQRRRAQIPGPGTSTGSGKPGAAHVTAGRAGWVVMLEHQRR